MNRRLDDAAKRANRVHAQRTRGLPPLSAARLRDVDRALAVDDVASAELALMSAALAAPDHPEVQRWTGALSLRQGRPVDAVAAFERALSARPDDVVVLRLLAATLGDIGEDERALRTLEGAAAAVSDLDEMLHLAIEFDRQGYSECSLALADRVVAAEPGNAKARLLRARCLQALGRAGDAAAEYRELIARKQEVAAAWYGMLDLKTIRISPDELVALEKETTSGAHPGDRGTMLDFALGKAYEDAGQHERAFVTFERANARARAQRPWSAVQFSAQVDELRDVFSRDVARADAEQGDEAIFIVGLPRSGTTLIEQVLAAHPQVEGASELPYLSRVIDAESQARRVPFPRWVPDASPADWTRMGRDYLRLSARWRRDRPRATDKLPANWLLAGAIQAMLPQARIIGLQREAVETCWSCYKQLFAVGLVGFAYDFESLAGYWHDYERLARFWAQRDPTRFRLQRYEAFVADPETQVRELLAFCGLPFDAACLRFNEAQRSVRTASAAQVRQPLRQDTARSAAYGERLAPLRAMLGNPGRP